MEFQFETARSDFKEKLSQDLSSEKANFVQSFSDLYGKYVGTETEKKTAADQTLRDLIKDNLNSIDQSSSTITNILDIVTTSVAVAKQGLCSPSIPFIILGDVLDCFTLDLCDVVFHYIEERVGIWKSTVFFTAGKNYLLRMCNDLLRRLSQSKNTVFCGRIQLFLARLFPLSEKSALNLVSQFNLENVTVFNKDAANSALKSPVENGNSEKMEIDAATNQADELIAIEESAIVDHKLYQHIWSLQDMFRYPVQCYTKEIWDKFALNADAVFRIFSSFKLEDVAHSRSTTATPHSNRVYFSKFLTSEKLINLQLNDGLFRRQILTQFLILLRYLTANVKFKGASLILSDKMKTWICDAEPQIYELLGETPPDGKRFARYIKHLMEREEYWISWKNEGCPSFMKTSKPPTEEDPVPSKKRKLEEKKSITDEFLSGKALGMGSPELTRLWSLFPDNLEACQSTSREFIPSLHDYFQECVEQNDPKNAIEEQYKNINKSNFQWKALRLLSHRSQLFFTSQPSTMQFKAVPDYLANVISKLSKDFPVPPDVENGLATEEEEEEENDDVKELEKEDDDVLDEGDDEMDDEDSNILNESQNTDTGSINDASNLLTSDDVTSFAGKIASNWKKLAEEFGMKSKNIKEIEEDSSDAVLQARQTLVTWQDLVGREATMTSLMRALKAAGLENICKESA